MQKTFVYNPYDCGVRKDGKIEKVEIYLVDLAQKADEKRDDIIAEIAKVSDGVFMFAKLNTERTKKLELRVMDNDVWNEKAATLKEGESKAGKVTRSEKGGILVKGVEATLDFTEKQVQFVVEKEEDATVEAIQEKNIMFLRITDKTELKGGTKYLTERAFYTFSKPVEE